MANLQIKGMEDALYAEIKRLAARENRSITQEALFLVKTSLACKQHLLASKTPAQVLLDMAGSWEDSRKASDIIASIKKGRKNSKKFRDGF